MNYKIITFSIFLLLSTFFSGLKNTLLKTFNFFRGAPPSYESLAGPNRLNAFNSTTINQSTYLFRGAPPSYESISESTGLNVSNRTTINENTYLFRGAPPSYESISGSTGLNASNSATHIQEQSSLLRGVNSSTSINAVETTTGSRGDITNKQKGLFLLGIGTGVAAIFLLLNAGIFFYFEIMMVSY